MVSGSKVKAELHGSRSAVRIRKKNNPEGAVLLRPETKGCSGSH